VVATRGAMQIYLPIAELSMNVFSLLLLGGGVGFLSGLFGVGGGFLMTPLLIFMGVPPAVAVGTQANQMVGGSVSGVLAHWRRGNVDVRLGTVMLAGGMLGTALGVWLFGALQALGQIDLAISVSYVLFLGGVGGLMLRESLTTLIKGRRSPSRAKLHRHNWLHGLPLKMRFPRSRLYISALLPGLIGFVGGLLVAIMGIGGGFLLVPTMIYLLGMPTALVAGTSLFQIIFTTAMAAFLQAISNQTVDIVLALLLLAGAAAGAQFGTRVSARLAGEQARLLLALLVLAVALKLAVDLVATPEDVYSITPGVAS
jgi:uncharacterized protein